MQIRHESILMKNMLVYEALNNTTEVAHVLIQDGVRTIMHRGVDVSVYEQEVGRCVDVKRQYTLIPEGMLDSHVHGFGGPDFSEVGGHPEKISTILNALGETGLSYVSATLVSLKLDTLKKCLQSIEAYLQEDQKPQLIPKAAIVNIHLEGPFISKNCKGAHPLEVLQERIDIQQFKDIISAAPSIKEWKITLAPDLPGAMQFILDAKALELEGISVKVFIGHTNPENMLDIDKAIEMGAAGFTHLGNACQETCCRLVSSLEPTRATSHVVQWVLENPDTCPKGVELIVDGVHLSQTFVSMVHKTIGDKIVLVTDALGPSGLADGTGVTSNSIGYALGELPLYKEDMSFYLRNSEGGISLKEGALPDGKEGLVKALAGSGAPLSFCIKKYSDWVLKHVESPQKRMEMLYKAAIQNPKLSALSHSAITHLPEDKNCVIFDNEGQLAASLCNGIFVTYENFSQLFLKQNSVYSGLNMYAQKETKPQVQVSDFEVQNACNFTNIQC